MSSGVPSTGGWRVLRSSEVVLADRGIYIALGMATTALRAMSGRDAIYPKTEWLAFHRDLKAAYLSISPIVSAEVPADEIEESLGDERLLTPKETAAMLGITTRQVLNKLADFGARQTGRFWLLSADLVEAEAVRRRGAPR